MSLAVVVPAWDPSRGGQERYLAGLLPWLARRGVAPVVVTARAAGPAEGRLVLIPGRGLGGGDRTRAFAAAAIDAARREGGGRVLATLALPGATHVQLHGGLLDDAFAAERAALPPGPRKRLFATANRWNGRRSALLALERSALAGPPWPRLMVWSASLRARLEEVHAVPPHAVTVVPPFVDTSVFHPVPRPEGAGAALRIAFASHVFALKGLRALLHALARLRARGVAATLEVAGRSRPGPFAALARRLGLGEAARFLGELPPAEVASLLRRSHVLAHPTFHDPCALVCLEALACGCPVVTTRLNGAADLLSGGEAGLVLESPDDAGALAGALEAFASGPARRRMGEAAAEIGARLGLDPHGERVLAWLGEA